MLEILKNKYTILLILIVISVSFIGGLEQKKTVEIESNGQVNRID